MKDETIARDEELRGGTIGAAVARLEELGFVYRRDDGAWEATSDHGGPHDVAGQAVHDKEAYRAYRMGRVDLMKDCAETVACRRWTVMNYFGEPTPGPCDTCDRGTAKKAHAARDRRQDAKHPFALRSRVRHREFGDGVVMEYGAGKSTVLFDAAGPKEMVTAYVIEHDLLAAVG